jgi:oligopeptide transport system permease protein
MNATARTVDGPAIAPAARPVLVRGTSLWRDAWRRLKRNRMAVASGVILLLIGGLTLLAPVIPGLADPNLQNLELGPTAPSWRHPCGTDLHGRDLLSRVLDGGRVSILVGLVATLVSFVVGVTYGAVAGYFGGRIDSIMMRGVDVLYSLPYMFLVILLMVYFSRSLWMLFAALGLVQWLTMARIVRGQVLSLKTQEFIEAARAVGAGSGHIIFKHLVPNALGPIIVYATLTVPAVMLQEAFLSFLGLGVQPPKASWGTLVNDGATVMAFFPWMVAFPGLALALTLFCLNFLGDGLRDALDPHLRHE